tara:strand:- start:239 stop:1228 length:990 start_codon:yes stop_codon:yes gene_type:complete
MSKKIIFFTSTFNTSGAEKQLFKIFNTLKDENKSTFVTAKGNSSNPDHISFNVKKTTYALFQLIKIVKNIKPDILFTTLPTPNLLNILVKKLGFINYKSIVRIANFNIELKTTKFILKHADIVLFNSTENLDLYKKRFPLLSNKFKYLNNIVEKNNIEKTKTGELISKGIVISRLTKNKGIDILIKAMNDIDNQNLKVDIFGNGPEYQELNSLIKNKNVSIKNENIKINDIWNHYSFLVLPSRKEGLSNVLLEAQYNNIFSIVSDCKTGNKEVIELTKNGVVFESDNFLDLKQKLTNFTKNEYPQKESREIIIQNYSNEKASQILKKLI